MRGNRAMAPAMLTLAGGLMVGAACAPLGAVGVVGGAPTRHAFIVEGEIRSVDTRRGRIQVRDQWNRGQTVHFSRDTQVVFHRRSYPVSALERGDRVRIRVAQGRNGVLWADRVDVRESVRDRRGVAGRVARVSGTVGAVDARRGHFTLQEARQSMVVLMPQRVTRDDARRFHRLRRGDRVRVEVRPVDRGVVELVRFR